MKKDYTQMFNILDEYLKDKVQGIDLTILEAVNARKNGKIFSFEEHLKLLNFYLINYKLELIQIIIPFHRFQFFLFLI